jgi:hypothetical protein
MPISQALKEVYASAPATQRYVDTLTFSHSLFPQTYYLTNDNMPWRFLLENGQSVTFTQVPFRIVLPSSDGKGNQDMGLTIANIGRELVDALEAAIAKPTEPIKCILRVYLDQAGSLPQNSPPLSLIITDVNYGREAVSATAGRMDVLNRAFPYNFYKLDSYPGLRR